MNDELFDIVEASKKLSEAYTESCMAAEKFVKQFGKALKNLTQDEEFMAYVTQYLESMDEEE